MTTPITKEQIEELKTRSDTEKLHNTLIEWTKSEHMRCRTVRQSIERQWYLNMAFYRGRQNVKTIPVSNSIGGQTGVKLYVPPAPYYRSRPVINKIRPAVRSFLSKLTSQKPTATIVPATSEDQDLRAATAGEQIWDSIYREYKVKTIFRRSALWMLTCGVGFIKSCWDPDKQAKDGNTGDFRYECVTPFHIFVPDMLAEDIEDQPYVIHIQVKTLEWVKTNFPGMKVEPNVAEAFDILNDSFLHLVGVTDIRRNSVLCYEVWIKPGHTTILPEGGMFTIIGENVVQLLKGNTYDHQQYPFIKFDCIPNGNFYADSVITDLIPIQRDYNRTRGQINENKNRMGHIQIVAAEGSVEAARITNEPGQVIQYKLGYPPPTSVSPAPLPSYITQDLDRLTMDFDDIAGQHQVSKGQVPPGVTAASAINFLQEQDETMLSTVFESVEEGFEKLGYQTLCYVKQYWETERLVKTVGRDGQFDVISFKGSDLRSNTDIRIEAGSALPTSRAAKQALLMDLMAQGFIPPEKGLELMEIGGVQRLYDELQIDNAQAARENMRMSTVDQEMMDQYLQTFMGEDPMTGEAQLIDPNTEQPLVDEEGNPTEPPLIVPVNSYDNHMVHIQSHNNYRKTQEFETLPQTNKDLFEAHVNQHLMALGLPPGIPLPDMGMSQQSAPLPPEEEVSENGE